MCRAASRSQRRVQVTVVRHEAQDCWGPRDRNGGCRTPLRARGQSCWFSSAENTPQKQVSTVSHPVDVTSSCDFRRRLPLIPITWLRCICAALPQWREPREETWTPQLWTLEGTESEERLEGCSMLYCTSVQEAHLITAWNSDSAAGDTSLRRL